MSYQVLARKWRPQNFAQLVGQEHVVTAISNALENNRLHHAYLFTGTRGVGKTTIARIFSKSLNCETGMSAEPCGQCNTCLDIDQGRYIDLLEIDAASRTKVEDTRDLLDNVQYKPSRGEYKVYLIDEVHMLSKHSFNALLKTLEEPPPHVKFLLATTDPQKLPVTILSRCLQFNLKAMSREQITGQLEHILQQEKLTFDGPALAQLARAANGSMRDALSLTDQAIAQGNGQVTIGVVSAMLGLMDKNQVLKLLNAVLEGNSQESMAQLDALASQSVDYSQLLAEMLSLLHQIALTQIVPDACKLETISAKAIYHLAKKVPAEHIQLQYQIVLQGRKDLSHAMDGRSGTEMTLLRMLAFNPQRQLVTPEDLANTSLTQADTLPAVDLTRVVEAQKTAVEPSDTHPVAVEPEGHGEQQYNELALQQAEIMQQAEAMQPQFSQADQDNTAVESDFFAQTPAVEANPAESALPAVSPASATEISPDSEEQVNPSAAIATSEVEQAPTSQLSQTEALLAMRRGLRQSEEDAASVKKSETKPVSLAAPSSLARSANIADVAVSSTESAAEAIEPPEPLSSLAYESQQQTSVESTSPTTSSSSAPIDESNPPWDMEDERQVNQENAEEQHSQTAISDEPEPEIPAYLMANANKASADATAADPETESFDDYADLLAANAVEAVDITIEVPTFLQAGEKVTQAQQLDSWSRDIDQSGIGGLTKQLALHSSMQRQQNQCRLTLLASQKHLNNEVAVTQLQQALSDLWQQPVELIIELGQPQDTPYGIQQAINTRRQEYAVEVIDKDHNIHAFKQQFDAQVVEGSIKAN